MKINPLLAKVLAVGFIVMLLVLALERIGSLVDERHPNGMATKDAPPEPAPPDPKTEPAPEPEPEPAPPPDEQGPP